MVKSLGSGLSELYLYTVFFTPLNIRISRVLSTPLRNKIWSCNKDQALTASVCVTLFLYLQFVYVVDSQLLQESTCVSSVVVYNLLPNIHGTWGLRDNKKENKSISIPYRVAMGVALHDLKEK